MEVDDDNILFLSNKEKEFIFFDLDSKQIVGMINFKKNIKHF